MLRAASLALCLAMVSTAISAQTEEPPTAEPPVAAPEVNLDGPMTPQRLVAILQALDPEATSAGGGIGLTIGDVPVLVFMDPGANRMRAIVPVASAEGLTQEDLMRIMQANFDSALDARYGIANGRLYSTFIHPLRELQNDQLIAGLAQTVTLAQTYGTFYSSGAAVFGGGDSAELHNNLLEELLERGQEL